MVWPRGQPMSGRWSPCGRCWEVSPPPSWNRLRSGPCGWRSSGQIRPCFRACGLPSRPMSGLWWKASRRAPARIRIATSTRPWPRRWPCPHSGLRWPCGAVGREAAHLPIYSMPRLPRSRPDSPRRPAEPQPMGATRDAQGPPWAIGALSSPRAPERFQRERRRSG